MLINITPFGKILRKIRIDRDLLLKDMARKLNVSSAFLSAVELGRKKIPQNLIDNIFKHYLLTQEEQDSLIKSIDEQSLELVIVFDNVIDKKLTLWFTDYVKKLSETEKKEILKQKSF